MINGYIFAVLILKPILVMSTQLDARVQQMLQVNGLDFNISKRALQDVDGNPSGYYGLYNDNLNKCIYTCKGGYHVSQNKEVVEMILRGTEKFGDDLIVRKAGAINSGRKVFMQLEIKGNAKVGQDVIKRYITLIDSNDGSTSLGLGIGDLTMSCANQFFKFYNSSDLKIRHSKTLEDKIKQIPRLIETALAKSMQQIKLYQEFESTSITLDLANAMVRHLLGIDRTASTLELSEMSTRATNKMDALYDCIESEIQDKGENLWGLHSGVTKFTTHELSSPKRFNGREETLMVGGGYKLNQKSLIFCEKKMELVY